MSIEETILNLTQKLLDSIPAGDWDTYLDLCDETLSCFEPEARGQLVHGHEFHKFYFDNLSHRLPVNTTITAPHIRVIGETVAVISYVRLQQRMGPDGSCSTQRHEETRVWELRGDQGWKLVHLHRSIGSP